MLFCPSRRRRNSLAAYYQEQLDAARLRLERKTKQAKKKKSLRRKK